MKEYCLNWYKENGAATVAAILAVMWKIWMFYSYMGVNNNFIAVWLITSFLVYLLFASFKNKWIPAVIYLVISGIMFADALYFSYFNRYLSVNMLGAAKFLGDISASIMAVLKPRFFLLLADCAVVFGALAHKAVRLRRAGKAELETESQLTDSEAVEDGLAAINAETAEVEDAITLAAADTEAAPPDTTVTPECVHGEETAVIESEQGTVEDTTVATETEAADREVAIAAEDTIAAAAQKAVSASYEAALPEDEAGDALKTPVCETAVCETESTAAESDVPAGESPAGGKSMVFGAEESADPNGQLVVLTEVKRVTSAEAEPEEIAEIPSALRYKDENGTKENEDMDVELDEEELGLSSGM